MQEVKGFVHDIRIVSNACFVVIRNRDGYFQLTIKKDNPIFEDAKKLKRESVILAECEKPQKQIAKIPELIPKTLEVISQPIDELPIDILEVTQTSLPKRLENRPLDLRKRKNLLIFLIQNSIVEEARKFLRENGFIEVFTPCLIGGISEGGSEVFEVDFFGRPSFLRQDPQLHRELLMLAGFEKIFEIGPSWRAEKSHTTRHLCEHRGIAVEMSFIKDEYEIIKLEEKLIEAIIKGVNKRFKEIIEKEFKAKLNFKTPFPIIEFPEVYEILKKKNIKPTADLKEKEEKAIWEYSVENFGSDFFFINKFPFSEKPFYVMKDEKSEYARSTDLMCKDIELSSGGQREHRYEKIIEQIKEKHLEPETLEWFTKYFKYGAPPHGGFNIGLERLTMALLDLKNIKEAALFPRDPERLLP
ncbi:MAG: aspartate--tRNA(Asn) ligase [Candidatus Micrarchaeia archaeon]